MKYQCSNCKSPVKEGDKTCPECGSKLVKQEKYREPSKETLTIRVIAIISTTLSSMYSIGLAGFLWADTPILHFKIHYGLISFGSLMGFIVIIV